ncbi:MAG: C45 family autoproteolytic acyltransferase/hydrolase [Coriobacteriales bacterium]|nr:C45 family autoproteolytic acyltransferase/hydrolase [Coriobacteriales bacterium]
MLSKNGTWKNGILAAMFATILAGWLTACGAPPQTSASVANSDTSAQAQSATSAEKSATSAEESSTSEAPVSATSGNTASQSESGGPISASDKAEEFEQGRKVARGDIKVVDLHGTWREMGRQYGQLMKKELEEVSTFLDGVIEAKEGNAEKAEAIIEQQVVQTPYRVCQFFEGAAETSGLTVDQLQKVNALERVAGLPKCSAAIAWGGYAASDLVIGRNYDWSNSFVQLKDDIAVTVYHPADGSLASATIGYVGEIYAVNGINEKGIFLELNNGKPSANISAPNQRVTGTTMLFEALFECDEIADMDYFFNTVNNSSSYIINVADEAEGRSYEWCPVDMKHGEDDLPDGLLVSTNYFVNPEWLFAKPTDANSFDAVTRRENLIKLCEEQKGKLDEAKMMEIIDKPLDDGGPKCDLTVYQMVVTPKTKTLWLQITGGSAWTQVDLNSFLNG